MADEAGTGRDVAEAHASGGDEGKRPGADGDGEPAGEARSLWLVQLRPKRTDMLTAGPTPEEAAAVTAHFQYLTKLTREGVVGLAGRTANADASAVGLVIVQATSEAAARRICIEGDPAVSAGVFEGTLLPYRLALLNSDVLTPHVLS